jgi:FkbM family methyltransferase
MGILAWGERLQRLAETTLTRGGVKALRRWRPFSLASFRLVRGLADEGLSFATVVDVGANAGQFSRACLGIWPDAHVIAFEPLPDVAGRVEVTVGRVGRVDVHACAVGASDGTTAFFPYENSLSSSALSVADGAKDEPWARPLAPITVPLRRLDTVLAGSTLARPALLKIDVQGFELDVLRGAEATLGQVDAVLVEVAFDPLYAGQPPYPAVDDALGRLGWALVRPLDFRRESGRIVEADLLYRRSRSQERGSVV